MLSNERLSRKHAATCPHEERSLDMSKPKHPQKTNDGQAQSAKAQSTKQIAKNAVHGGPKDPKKDKRVGVGRGQKG